VSRPVARYTSSRRCYSLALVALSAAVVCGWFGLRWPPVWIAAGALAASAFCVLLLALRPAIEIHDGHLLIGRRAIAWGDIRRLDQTGWNAPLAVYLTLADEQRVLVVHPGDLDSSTSLLRHLRRYARTALLDGIPYAQFWGETPAAEKPPAEQPAKEEHAVAQKYPLLRPEDEEEVERMFQRLKSVGRIDQRNSEDQ
jgi:hypothetical protein